MAFSTRRPSLFVNQTVHLKDVDVPGVPHWLSDSPGSHMLSSSSPTRSYVPPGGPAVSISHSQGPSGPWLARGRCAGSLRVLRCELWDPNIPPSWRSTSCPVASHLQPQQPGLRLLGDGSRGAGPAPVTWGQATRLVWALMGEGRPEGHRAASPERPGAVRVPSPAQPATSFCSAPRVCSPGQPPGKEQSPGREIQQPTSLPWALMGYTVISLSPWMQASQIRPISEGRGGGHGQEELGPGRHCPRWMGTIGQLSLLHCFNPGLCHHRSPSQGTVPGITLCPEAGEEPEGKAGQPTAQVRVKAWKPPRVKQRRPVPAESSVLGG